ncbi:hypothetical protein FQA39_LY00457 [Lamprigera yunnana]|nr:hypothetical protein FQA39_LY00457 [Lamprigera yunnana]
MRSKNQDEALLEEIPSDQEPIVDDPETDDDEMFNPITNRQSQYNILSRLRRQKWRNAIKCEDIDDKKLKYAVVCSKHITEDVLLENEHFSLEIENISDDNGNELHNQSDEQFDFENIPIFFTNDKIENFTQKDAHNLTSTSKHHKHCSQILQEFQVLMDTTNLPSTSIEEKCVFQIPKENLATKNVDEHESTQNKNQSTGLRETEDDNIIPPSSHMNDK